jgi:hypothetical protein
MQPIYATFPESAKSIFDCTEGATISRFGCNGRFWRVIGRPARVKARGGLSSRRTRINSPAKETRELVEASISRIYSLGDSPVSNEDIVNQGEPFGMSFEMSPCHLDRVR